MCNILFLDVDGVLNNREVAISQNKTHPLGDEQLELLSRIMENVDCEIVLSSTWRRSGLAKKALQLGFERFGIPMWVDQTPCIDHVPRKDEIMVWLSERQSCCASDIRVVIVDDDLDAALDGTFFVHTTWEKGLTEELADSIVKFLT